MPEIEKTEDLEIVPQLSVVESQERANIDMLISTAKRYPRNITSVKRTMEAMATLDEDTAESCNYHLERNGKSIDGPSVRMAEIAVACYQNVRCGSRIISNDGKVVTGQAFCHDLENNTFIAWETQRRITDKSGRTYGEDMQVLTGNAASAIAFRNAVFKIIPGALIRPVAEKARQVAVGDLRTLRERRTRALKKFASIGVREDQLLAFLGRASAELIDIVDVEKLFGVFTAIKEGSTTVEEQFPPIGTAEPIKAQVPPRRGRPPKSETIDVKAEEGEPKHETAPERVTPTTESKTEPTPATAAASPAPAAQRTTVEQSLEPFPEPKETPKRKEPASKQVAPELSPAFGLEPAANRDEPLPQIKETKPASGEELGRRLAAAIAEDSAANKIRSKLLEVGISEEEMIKWLGALGTVSDKKTVSLDKVDAKWLKMVLDGWDGVQDRLKEFLLENKNK